MYFLKETLNTIKIILWKIFIVCTAILSILILISVATMDIILFPFMLMVSLASDISVLFFYSSYIVHKFTILFSGLAYFEEKYVFKEK